MMMRMMMMMIVVMVFGTDDVLLERLKSLGPAAVELELSLLSSASVDATDDDDVELVVNFIDFLTYLFSTKRDVDLATSYLGLLLKVSSRSFVIIVYDTLLKVISRSLIRCVAYIDRQECISLSRVCTHHCSVTRSTCLCHC